MEISSLVSRFLKPGLLPLPENTADVLSNAISTLHEWRPDELSNSENREYDDAINGLTGILQVMEANEAIQKK